MKEDTIYFWYSDEYFEIDYSCVNYPNTMDKPHKHWEVFEILYIFFGKRRVLVNNVLYDIEKGGLILFDLEEEHCSINAEVKSYEKINIYIKREFATYILPDMDGFNVLSVFKMKHKVLQLSKSEQIYCENLFNNIINECMKKELGFNMRIIVLLIDLLIIVYRNLNTLENSEKKQSDDYKTKKINNIIKYINEVGFQQRLTLKSLSVKFNISRYYLCRLFKEVTGINYIEYLTTLKMNKAKKLLVETNMDMIEISEIIGYQSLSNFERTFKKYTGVSPLKFRKMAATK